MDIAGLVQRAQTRAVWAAVPGDITQHQTLRVVRYFKDPDVNFTLRCVNQQDVDVIQTELILAGLGTIERALPKLEKRPSAIRTSSLSSTWQSVFRNWLNEDPDSAAFMEMTDDERLAARDLFLPAEASPVRRKKRRQGHAREAGSCHHVRCSVCAGVEAEAC